MNEEYIAIEALEVLINHILYIRGVYPKEIFQKKRVYNCPIFVSIYPHLNEYIAKVLSTARALKTEKKLSKVEVLIYKDKDQKCVYEKYVFDITNTSDVDAANGDEYLFDLEEQLRVALYQLSERAMSLGKLSEDVVVKLQLHTNQSTYVKICKDSCKDIPWLQVSIPSKSTMQQATFPLTELTECGINISIEI